MQQFLNPAIVGAHSSNSAPDGNDTGFHRLLEKLPGGAYTCDAEGQITFFNQNAVRIWGREPDLNSPVDRFCGSFKLFSPEGHAIAHDECWMALALQNDKEYNNHEIVIERPSGERRTVLAHANPIHDEFGELVGAVNVLVDITDRKKVEQELIRAKHELSDFVENAAIGLHWVGPDGTILWANRAELEMLGYAKHEYVGRNISEFHLDREGIEKLLDRLHNFEEIHEYEALLRCKDGSINHVVIDTNVFWEDGKFVHTRCFTRDVTRRKQAEKARYESEERYSSLVEAITSIVWTTDPQGRFVTPQPGWAAYTGQREEELRDFGWADALHADDREEVLKRWHAAREAKTLYESEGRLWHAASQTYRHFEARGVPIFDYDKTVREWVGLCLDVEERKRAEIELLQLNESLERQVEERTQMLSILQDITRAANEAHTVEEALRAALERIADYNGWQVGHAWRLADDGQGWVSSGVWHIAHDADLAIGQLVRFQEICAQTRFARGEMVIGAVAESGQPAWLDDIGKFADWRRGDAAELGLHAVIAFPIFANSDVVAVLEFFSDHPARREARFIEIMPDVGIQLGHLIERKRLERAVAESVAQQQREFGQELHDNIAQELTGTSMMAESLRQTLANEGSPRAEDAEALKKQLTHAHQQIQRLARGLIPVEVDAEGLRVALDDLAERCQEMYDVPCVFESEGSVMLEDNDVATHLYRIAQEAIQNAVKHGQARRIDIRLTSNDQLLLTVSDDGGGLREQPHAGTGHRIMRYRAGLIGGELNIESNEQGVRVVCRVKR